MKYETMNTFENPALEEQGENMSGSPKTIAERVTPRMEELAMGLLRDKGTFKEILQELIDLVGEHKVKTTFFVYKYVYQKNLKELGKPEITEQGFDKIFNELFTSKEQLANEFFNLVEMDSVEDSSIKSENNDLEKHMQSFDDLGFNNPKVYDWRKSILTALQSDGYEMSDFYFTSDNSDNKALLQHVALMENAYNFLNSKGLINRGFCPITGEDINNSYNYNIFGRIVYLSKTGLETCTNIDRKKWNKGNKSSLDYDTFQNLKKQVKYQKQESYSQGRRIISLLVLVISFVVNWFVLSPTSLKTYIGYFLIAIVTWRALGLGFFFGYNKVDENTDIK